MKKFEMLEHKADLKIRAFGKTKKELFLNMLLGMTESQRPEVLPEKVKREIKIKSFGLEALLVDFLSEALYQSQVNMEAYNSAEFKKFTDTPHQSPAQKQVLYGAGKFGAGQAEIEGKLIGQKVERFGEDIKAVTYHGLGIHQKEDRSWETTVLFDI